MEEQHVEHLEKINQYWEDIFSNLLILNNINSGDVSGEIIPYIVQLSLLPVSKKSIFSDMLWDYDWDTRNRSSSLTLTRVQLDFIKYQHIPLGVITEIKCLFLAVKASPKCFGHRKNEIKPQTLIGIFQAGLAFLNFTFSEMKKRLGKEYVQNQCCKLSAITLLDFEEAAKKITLKILSEKRKQNSYRDFLRYLNTNKAKNEIGIECKADYGAVKKAYEKHSKKINDKKKKKLPYLETKEFDLALKKASFNVVSFLRSIDEKVNDSIMDKHYQTLATTYEEFSYSKQEFEDYGAYRLNRKGYTLADINTIFPHNQIAKFDSNVEPTSAAVEIRFRKRNLSIEPFRIAINKAFYSALWVIGSLMGARPNVYFSMKIDDCLDLKNNTIISEEHKGRDNRWNLFNDSWIAIPIMIDAIKVIELIGSKVFRNKYVFGNVFTLKPDEISKPIATIYFIIQHAFKAITGIPSDGINSKLNGYVFRHSLAHQMYRADVGLPVISYQLKHIVSAVDAFSRKGRVSQTTLGYGGVANQLTTIDNKALNLRDVAELDAVKVNFNPNGKFMGGKAEEHILKIKKFFNGCMEAGYTEEEIYDAMVEQGLAIINVGSGYCFGGVEDFDESLPCVGSLRCNPVRCHNAVVTKANAPKWREIYLSNLKLIGAEGYEDRQDQIGEAIAESKRVLEYLGEELI